MKLWTKEQKAFLNLSTKESRLLEVLHAHGAQNTSALAYRAKIPRVTAMRLLKILHTRGFVQRKATQHEVYWSVISQSVLIKQFETIFTQDDKKIDTVDLSEVGNLVVYHGIEAMLASNKKILRAHPGERLLGIEPNGVWKHFKNVVPDAWVELNQLFAEQRIVAEVILEEGFDAYATMDDSFFSIVKDARVVPAGFLDSSTEILIFRDQVLFMDWAHLVAVEIKDPSLTRVIKAMYRSLQESGRSVQIR